MLKEMVYQLNKKKINHILMMKICGEILEKVEK
jgi:hypothetical protein